MSYDRRRRRLHGIIQRLPGTQRYRLTEAGLKTALFYSRVQQRLLRPGMSLLHDQRRREPPAPGPEFPGVPHPIDRILSGTTGRLKTCSVHSMF